MENKFASRTYGFTINFRIHTLYLPRTSLLPTIQIMLLPALMSLPTVYEKIRGDESEKAERKFGAGYKMSPPTMFLAFHLPHHHTYTFKILRMLVLYGS